MSETGRTRPGSGVDIDPATLQRLRVDRKMSRADLSRRMTAIWADAHRFAGITRQIARGHAKTIAQAEAGEIVLIPGAWRLLCDALDCKRYDLSPVTLAETRMFRGQPLRDLPAQILPACATLSGVPLTYTVNAISKLEDGLRKPKTRTLRCLCAALDCQPDDLRAPASADTAMAS